MFGSIKDALDLVSQKGVLSWVVLAGVMLNVPILFGCDRIIPEIVEFPGIEDSCAVSLIRYLAIAVAPIIVMDLVSRIVFKSAFRKDDDVTAGQHRGQLRFPVGLRWSCSHLALVVCHLFSIVLLYLNLQFDFFGQIVVWVIADKSLGGCLTLFVVLVGVLNSVIHTFKYCFLYWKINEADKALSSTFERFG